GSRRQFSYGCVRIERPRDLARALLGGAWTGERVDSALAAERSDTFPVSPPVPIYFLYWTVWADEDGAVQFRDDVYRIDYRHNWAWQQRDREAARGLGSPP